MILTDNEIKRLINLSERDNNTFSGEYVHNILECAPTLLSELPRLRAALGVAKNILIGVAHCLDCVNCSDASHGAIAEINRIENESEQK